MSAVLALLGFRVRCVCYSDYLSGRDYELFRELFEAFGIERLVTYSTIGEYSEDVTKRKGDIRVLTKALLLGQAAAGPTSAAGAAATSANGSGRRAAPRAPVPTAAVPAWHQHLALPLLTRGRRIEHRGLWAGGGGWRESGSL